MGKRSKQEMVSSDETVMDIRERYLERNRTHDEIRRSGAIANLQEGIEITTHGVSTRIIAWPGNGFQTESVHVLTLKPGEASEMYRYDMSEESLVCIKGKGEVFLRGQWVEIEAGDIAFFPERVERGIRNSEENQANFILANQIAPPQFDLYAPAGYYNIEHGVMNFEAIEEAKKQTKSSNLPTENEMHLNESSPEVRAWNLTAEEIRQEGALFNMFRGASFGELGTPMVLVLWPGYAARSAGIHSGLLPPGQLAEVHTHPDSDEAICSFFGPATNYCGDRWLDGEPWDVVLAPCGVHHSTGGSRDPNAGVDGGGVGFAAPPQLDLYLRTPHYKDGKFVEPPWTTLDF